LTGGRAKPKKTNMNIIFGLFTVILFLDCILLIAFVLVQLPKKEAGAGMAFGGAATDALFGAGSGSAVTIITKYLAGIFFGLSLLMAIMTSNHGQTTGSALEKELTKGATSPASHTISEPASGTPAAAPGSNGFMQSAPPSGTAASNGAATSPAPSSGNLLSMPSSPPPSATNK
jgi:preprotein translocase subunit SecG